MLTASGVGAEPPALSREPDGLKLMRNVGSAGWVVDRLTGWTSNWGRLIGSIIPSGFEAYARILHPAKQQSEDGEWHRVSWSTVASWNGKVVHPQAAFHRIANLDPMMYKKPSWGRAPFAGTLPEEECGHLVGILRKFTATPTRCYFGVWNGYTPLDALYQNKVDTLKVPGREEFYLYCGPLDGILSFYEWSFFYRSPNIWWPEDCAWFVATEIDSLDSYVGGSAACIERILEHPELETYPTTVDTLANGIGDTINV